MSLVFLAPMPFLGSQHIVMKVTPRFTARCY
jgi:hypothetical protein